MEEIIKINIKEIEAFGECAKYDKEIGIHKSGEDFMIAIKPIDGNDERTIYLDLTKVQALILSDVLKRFANSE